MRSGHWLCILWAAVTAGCAADRVTLLPEPGRTTAVEVRSGATSVVLSQPYEVAEVSGGRVAKSTTTADEVRARNALLLELRPPASERHTLRFEPGGAQLTAESQAALPAIISAARQRQGGEIVVTGHTDRVGSAAANDLLAQQRAQFVRSLLVDAGFPAARILAIGRGEREPLVSTADEVAEPANRRVEIEVR